MKKNLLLVILFTAVLILISYENVVTFASGAPDGKTGAPTEGTCISCHAGTVNSGTGTAAISLNDSVYAVNQSYTVTVSITQTGVTKSGFELTAMDASNNKIGTFTLINSANTKGTTYITHTSAGTASNSWTVTWKAPSTNVGAVTFYAAFNASNNDGGSGGDNIYTKSLAVNPATGTSMPETDNIPDALIKTYPNPALGDLNISYEVKKTSNVEVYLLDVAGKKIKTFSSENKNAGICTDNIYVGDLSSGIYFVRIKMGEELITQKILIQ